MKLRLLNRLVEIGTIGVVVLLIVSAIPSSIASEHIESESVYSPEEYKIYLQSRQFVPPPGISPSTKANIATSPLERVHVLMQFQHIPNANERRSLEEADVELLAYIPNNAWFTSIPTNSLTEITTISSVRWLGDILPEDKVLPRIQEKGVGSWAMNLDGTVNIIVKFFDDVSVANAKSILMKYYSTVKGPGMLNDWTVTVTSDAIWELAYEDGVQWIEEVPPPETTFNDGSRNRVGATIVQAAPYNLDGTNVQVGVWDGGEIDNSSSPHPDLTGRITIIENAPISDHATHVTGTMMGDGSASGGTYRGMATNVTAYSYTFLYNNLMPEEHNGAINTYGIDISQNSWGFVINETLYGNCDLYGDYSLMTQKYDNVVRGCYGRYIPIIFAAGNERNHGDCGISARGGYACLPGPGGTAKNTIVVGAINSDDDSMTSFSSWGPTDDSRIKPDVVAPGGQTGFAGIVSTMPDGVVTDDFINGVCPPQLGSDGIDDFFFPYTNSNGPGSQDPACEDIWEGTSMAAPCVSGCAALMIQDYRNTHDNVDPWPSTIKALLTDLPTPN